MDRRKFLKIMGATGALAAIPWQLRRGRWLQMAQAHAAVAVSPGLEKFIQPLRGENVGSLLANIPVAAPDSTPAPVTGVTHYTININQFNDKLHPQLRPTTLWGYDPKIHLGGGTTQKHLGGIIVAQKGTPIQITFRNNLTSDGTPNGVPLNPIIPIDTTIPGANQAPNRVAVHLHGGFVPWISDGGPHDWWAPDGTHGLSFLNNAVLNPDAAPNEAEYFYPNAQSARFVWYHDHAWGITRTNAYAGVATGYIIRDLFEANLVATKGLPDFIEHGGREIVLAIQEKIFYNPSTFNDPTWIGLPSNLGSLWYTHTYDPNVYELQPGGLPLQDPSVIPEFFGDTMLVNGSVYPKATVEARRYRLRVLNATNARFLNLQLYVANPNNPDGIDLNPTTLTPTNPKGPDFLVIGTEGGFLPKPTLVPSNKPFNPVTISGSLILGNAERSDIIIDFTGFADAELILYNDAPAPFPNGNPAFDYFLGNPNNPVQPQPGFGPDTRQLMRFKVIPATSVDPPLNITPATDLRLGNDPLLVPAGQTVVNGVIKFPPGTRRVRQLTLNEAFDAYGRLIQLLGTNAELVPGGGYGRAYMDASTENPTAGDIEVWQIANLTGDTHPIHFHLVNVQILARQPFNDAIYNGTPTYLGPPVMPNPDECGWKDTCRMNPAEVITVAMKFTLPKVPFNIPTSPRAALSVNQGGLGVTVPAGRKAHEYVWHCHILEHEEHDMMRPLVVIG